MSDFEGFHFLNEFYGEILTEEKFTAEWAEIDKIDGKATLETVSLKLFADGITSGKFEWHQKLYY